jgi:hypothetical protein
MGTTSIGESGYLCGTPCHVGNDGSNRYQMVATTRANMSTALFQKLRLSNARKSRVAMHRVHNTTHFKLPMELRQH